MRCLRFPFTIATAKAMQMLPPYFFIVFRNWHGVGTSMPIQQELRRRPSTALHRYFLCKGRPQDVLQTHTFSWQWPQGPLQASPMFRPDQVCSIQFKASTAVLAQRGLVDFARTRIRGLFRTAMESVAIQQRFSNCSAPIPVVSSIQRGVLLIAFSNGNQSEISQNA